MKCGTTGLVFRAASAFLDEPIQGLIDQRLVTGAATAILASAAHIVCSGWALSRESLRPTYSSDPGGNALGKDRRA